MSNACQAVGAEEGHNGLWLQKQLWHIFGWISLPIILFFSFVFFKEKKFEVTTLDKFHCRVITCKFYKRCNPQTQFLDDIFNFKNINGIWTRNTQSIKRRANLYLPWHSSSLSYAIQIMHEKKRKELIPHNLGHLCLSQIGLLSSLRCDL